MAGETGAAATLKPTGQAHLSLGLGALLLAGGVAGWVKGQSRASLVAG
jgi:hypothetical protein